MYTIRSLFFSKNLGKEKGYLKLLRNFILRKVLRNMHLIQVNGTIIFI